MYLLSIPRHRSHLACYEGEGSGTPTTTPTPTPTVTPTTTQVNPTTGRMFTQEEVNALVANDKRTLRVKNEQLAAELENIKNSKNLTEQEKNDLQTHIDSLTSQYQTEKEQKEQAIDKLQKKFDTESKRLGSEVEGWKSRYEQAVIGHEIVAASAINKAFNPDQIMAVLAPKTKVQETLDAAGKPTGQLAPRVNFKAVRDGKEVELNLSVAEAVKQMTEMPETYGNLFRTDANSGLGYSGNGASGDASKLGNLDQMNPQQYAAARGQIRTQLQNTRGI